MLAHIYPLMLAANGDNWLQSLLDVSPNDRLSVVIVSIVFAAGIIIASVAIVGGFVHTYSRHRLEADLKRELLDRGLSPDEVVRVVESSAGKGVNRRQIT
ncbi:MAG TPA: hypothetical protein VGM76_06955 [Lacipirellulaceae bacterium]|jgi:hypothetical protein